MFESRTDGAAASPVSDARLAAVGIVPPLVSVIVTSYNYAAYVVQCLDSVRAQTYPHWELIIVDDRSTDGSDEILRDYAARHGAERPILYFRRETNGGQMEAFRDGLARARGVFVVMLDADDVLLPDFLAVHMAVHLGRKEVAFTSSDQYQIDERGQLIGGDHPDHLSKGKYRYVPQQTFYKTWWIWATASSMVFRRATLDLVMPGPDVSFRICADYYFAHFCQQVGNSILIPGVHGCYRRHLNNNFSANPLVGALNSLGDFGKHPPHDEYRKAMIRHILTNTERFLPIFGPGGLAMLLFRLAKWGEVGRIVRENPKIFAPCRANMRWRYAHMRLDRFWYERSPWRKRLMVIDPPQRAFVPPPPTPGKILAATVRRRLAGILLGRKGKA